MSSDCVPPKITAKLVDGSIDDIIRKGLSLPGMILIICAFTQIPRRDITRLLQLTHAEMDSNFSAPWLCGCMQPTRRFFRPVSLNVPQQLTCRLVEMIRKWNILLVKGRVREMPVLGRIGNEMITGRIVRSRFCSVRIPLMSRTRLSIVPPAETLYVPERTGSSWSTTRVEVGSAPCLATSATRTPVYKSASTKIWLID
jgi:hypothetical protein